MRICTLRRKYDLCVRRPRFSITDIVHDRTRKQVDILLNNTDIISQIGKLHISNVHTINLNSSLRHFIESWNQTAKCCLTHTGRADKRHILSGMHLQINMVQHLLLIILIMERNILEFDVALQIPHLDCVRLICNIRRD